MNTNVPQTEIKAIRGIIELSDSNNISKRVTTARKIYSEHEKQGFIARCIGSITGSNNRERIKAGQELSVAVEHLNGLSQQLSHEVAQNGERILTNTSFISVNAGAISCLSDDFIKLADENIQLQTQFHSLIEKQQEYNNKFQSVLNGIQAHQYITGLAESWQSRSIFQGYHPVIQVALFIDCVFANWKNEVKYNNEITEYLYHKAVNILTELHPQERIFSYKYGDFTLDNNDKKLDLDSSNDLQICLPEYKKNNGSFLTSNALKKDYSIWGSQANLNIVETDKSLVRVLIQEQQSEALKTENNQGTDYIWTSQAPRNYLDHYSLFPSNDTTIKQGLINETYESRGNPKNLNPTQEITSNTYHSNNDNLGTIPDLTPTTINDMGTLTTTLKNLDNFHFSGYGDDSTGHGFVAEDYNSVSDKLDFNNAKVIGGDNAKNGADRLVNGIEIQTKYYANGIKSINALFENNGEGMYKYIDSNGHIMQAEVPSDQYEQAVETLAKKIAEGKVPHIKNPAQAKEIIRKGNLTYTQAKNVAKAGNVDSLKFDMQAGAITASFAGGVAFAVTLSMALLNKQPFQEALENSITALAKASSIAFGSHIATSQISKYISNNITGKDIQYSLQAYVKPLLQKTGLKYGFLSNISKGTVLKGINTGVVALIMVLPDLYQGIISNSISKSQMCKNIGVVGAGAGIGLLVPGVGWAITAGIVGSMAAKFVLDFFIKDDIEEMKPIFEKAGNQIAIDYMLTEDESELYSVEIIHILAESSFWHSCHSACYNSSHKHQSYYDFMYKQLDIIAEKIVKTRASIKLASILHNQAVFEAEFEQVRIEQSKYKQQSNQRTDKLQEIHHNSTQIQKLLDNF